MIVSAQISIYPLGTDDLSQAIDLAIGTLEQHEISLQVGNMSTIITGELVVVQQAIDEMFKNVAAKYAVVMQCTMSNSCPLDSEASE